MVPPDSKFLGNSDLHNVANIAIKPSGDGVGLARMHHF
jgi:hypothetical protein